MAGIYEGVWMKQFIVASYSKAQTKTKLKEIVKENPKNPPVDLTETGAGPYGTPEEIREVFGITQIVVVGPRRRWFATLKHTNGEWRVS